jgi:hypothetical protein
MNRIVFLYAAILALGIAAIPEVSSLFADQHTFYSAAGISCTSCHSDVGSQLDIDNYVNARHKEAALNYNYTTYLAIGGISYNTSTRNITAYGNNVWYWNGSVWVNDSDTSQFRNVSLDRNGNGAIDGDEVCRLCHGRNLLGVEPHAGTTMMSACDEDRCHGNSKFRYNDPGLFGISANVTAAGYNISFGNIHSSYYLTMSNQTSTYPAVPLFGYTHGNTNSSYISRGYYTCLGCHSDVNVNVTLVLAPTYEHDDINMQQGRYQ